MCNKFFNQIFQPEGFDISIWRKSASRLQAAAQPYRVSPVIGQPGSPCKTAVEPTFCGRKFLVLAIWLRDLFFFGFHPNILYFFLRGLTFGDFVQNFCAARMSLEAAKRLCIFFEQTKKDKKNSCNTSPVWTPLLKKWSLPWPLNSENSLSELGDRQGLSHPSFLT